MIGSFVFNYCIMLMREKWRRYFEVLNMLFCLKCVRYIPTRQRICLVGKSCLNRTLAQK